MRHEPNIAGAAAHPLSCACIDCGPILDAAPAAPGVAATMLMPRSTRICVTIAAVAFFLVPGRFLLVTIAPAAAHALGFGR